MFKKIGPIITFILLSSSKANEQVGKQLQILEIKMGSNDGDGMDGGFMGNKNWGGGRFYFTFRTSEGQECDTGKLNSDEDNWEVGEFNYFVGRQLGNCAGFDLSNPNMTLTVRHAGNNGGRIASVKLLTAKRHQGIRFRCMVNQKLDNDETHTVQCKQLSLPRKQSAKDCQGNRRFCGLKFNQTSFAGAHNAGTGMLSHLLMDCYVTNHDLNVVELLDFGIRFFDFDLKYYKKDENDKDDLWTGHGPKDLFFTTARFEKALQEIKQWMIKHPNELVIVYVGSLVGDDRSLGLEKLTQLLEKHFSDQVKLNDYWRLHKAWPTLETAIDSQKRLFAIARMKTDEDINHIGSKIIPELPVKDDGKNEDLNHDKDMVTILSTYKSQNVGTACQNIVDQTGNVCQRKRETDLSKLAIFATHYKNNKLKCIHDHASDCNRQIKDSIQACKRQSGRKAVNFIQTDYPNYAPNGLTSVQIAYDQNMAQVQSIGYSTKKSDFEIEKLELN